MGARLSAPKLSKKEMIMVTDLVCGMTIEPRRTWAKAKHKGKTYYFCTSKCHQAFTADPEKYIKGMRSRSKSRAAANIIAVSASERHRMIAQKAYYRAEGRSFAPGGELEDWMLAEADIDRVLEGG
jgi:Cu+-exporting ATPase